MITFKHNFPLTFSDLLPNCWQSTGVHKCDGITRLFTVTRLYKCVAEEGYKTAESLLGFPPGMAGREISREIWGFGISRFPENLCRDPGKFSYTVPD